MGALHWISLARSVAGEPQWGQTCAAVGRYGADVDGDVIFRILECHRP